MTPSTIQALVLAAGKSTRFNTQSSKLLQKLCGQEMILYPLHVLESLNIPISLVVGYQADDILECVSKNTHKPYTYVVQEEQRGTGHALQRTQQLWNSDHVLVLNGDMPLITQDIIQQLIDTHLGNDASISFVTAHLSEPSSYGRVIEENGSIQIVEAKHFKQNVSDHCCINAGVYLFKRSFLEETLAQLTQNNETQEYYITDLVQIASQKKYVVKTVQVPFDNIRGVNTMKELWAAEHVKRSDLISSWMSRGVRFNAAHTVQIDINVTIGAGTTIGCSVHLLNRTVIGNNCLIESFSTLDNVTLGDHVHIKQNSLMYNSTIGNNSQIGPFAHVQEHTTIGNKSAIGNFVEIKRSTIGNNTKIKHLAYIGDAAIGNNVNIGAGTITCNYDGAEKQKTIIKDNVFVGSNNTLIAPLTIEEGSYTAGGSVITDNIPHDSLAIGRARQVTKQGYRKRYVASHNHNQSTP